MAQHVYYFSDPNATTREGRFHEFITDTELPEPLPWHFHTDKPDESLKAPVWSEIENKWINDDQSTIPAIVANLSANVEQLKEDHESSVKANDKVTTSLEAVQKGQAQQTQMMSQIMAVLSTMQSETNKEAK